MAMKDQVKIIMPLYFMVERKTKDDKKCVINLNQYRNWHYQLSNLLKKKYCEYAWHQLKDHTFNFEISLKFVLYKEKNYKQDRSNALSIHEKFFCDAMVYAGCIGDDNDKFIESSHYYTGGVDRNNPRVEIIITPAKPSEFQ